VTAVFSVRIANVDDAGEVSALLEASYTRQLADGYSPEMLAKALPLMVKANPRLLASGTYYIAQTAAQLVGCGGWTKEAPGSGEIKDGTGHIRHVATHPDWLRHGIGSTILLRCFHDAAVAGLMSLECHSTLVAVGFYTALGFTIIGPLAMKLAPDVSIQGVLLRRNLLGYKSP
jgi:N-acetylglutamate synthase-like GNAT family acetyltransferase